MGFHAFSSPYDWGRIAEFKATAARVPGGMADLSVGSPVDPVPQSVVDALVASADAPNAHGYPVTAGTKELKDAMAYWFRHLRGVDLDAVGARAVPTVGSKEGVALMASLLHLGEGDVVVQPRVSYPTYEIGTQIAGARVLKVDDVADVSSWEHEPGVRAVWVNSPCNPSGEVLSAAQLAGIVAAARRIGAVVLSDECYALMDWRGTDASTAVESNEPVAAQAYCLTATPCALSPQVCGGSADGVLVLYSLSKQSNMAGYRTALVAGDAGLVAEMSDYRKQIGQIIPGPVQAAMAAGLRDVSAVHAQHECYRRRLSTLVEALRAYGYDAAMPEGALYVWVRALSGDCWKDMASLARLGVVPSPGEFYAAPEYLRFAATATDAVIDLAAERLRQAGSER
ncbi:succinyldiaminopimelate transaminase [Bifidobacterium avesanii]|uniref:Succinyldiaminopimelate transaminase n=1 Tax=Bifidobacterium avesanii TaxID=1798157 RepID=A0A7K3TJI3_9BIFI|nr:succinyldiaminopimelate transaminase [Bifidobacterium avesanii]KAB8288915.1 succinyldiaminopimelate transaminase [Bifidobacterium avesanii]NEG79192.1 succinyldiaminopimelate transaminase [Bifidobacterium avesanii]